VFEDLPYGVSSHQLVDVHGRKTFLLGGVSDVEPSGMPTPPNALKKTEEVHGYVLPYILLSIRNRPFQPVSGAFMTPRCDF